MATPMFRELSRALEAPEEGRELWSGVPVEEEPAYAEEMFRKASDAALARENARLKEGYVPAGTGPMVEPSLDSTMAPMPSGLRSRKPVDFTPDTTKMQGKLAGFLGGDRPLASPIPVANASTRVDATVPTTSALPSAGPQTPAGKPESMGAPGLPAPETGAGGDTSERDLYLARLAAQSAAGFGGMGAGKNIDMGIADTLGERLKQVQALRAKREERAEVLAQERTQNDQLLDAYKGMFPEQATELESLRGATGKPMFRDLLAAWQKKTEFEKAKLPTAEARVAQMGAGTDFTKARTAEVGPEGESRRLKREQDIALGWARLNAQMAQAAARASQDVAAAGASRAEQRDVDGQLENIQKIVKAGSYTPLIASLEQADKAIADLGAPPSAAAQVKHALPGGDRFLSPQEKAYYTSVDKLRQMDQLAVSGKVVSEPERAEFLRQYGANWYASPKAAAAYIDMLRAKTASQLNSDLASVRASPSGQKALAAYERQPGAVTPMHPVFKGVETATRPAKPTEVPAGKTILWNVTEKKWKAVPTENADAAVKSGKYER